MEKSIIKAKCPKQFWFVFFLCLLALFFCYYRALFSGQNGVILFPNYANSFISQESVVRLEPVFKQPVKDSCSGRYIYIHDLPTRFNTDMLKHCSSLIKWFDMCEAISNMGLGPYLPNSSENKSWFVTNQFTLELIFHNRMKKYKCLTNDSQMASAIYVPFYAGLDIGRYLWGSNTSVRDSASIDLAKWLYEKPEWGYLSGRDHFFVAGRVTWDFNRDIEDDAGWGNKLMLLPQIKNTTSLIIESNTWTEREIGIPYPTYFHPSTDDEVFQYQEKLRRLRRKYLFSFAGAPRPTRIDSIRGEIIDQCIASGRKCKFLNCSSGSETCENPISVMGILKKSSFCLQPPGDSFTRRSTFDSILGGCIPVFFHPSSAYSQYIWHLPKNFTKYSVFIPEYDIKNRNTSVEAWLLRIPKEEVEAMREEVVRLIPKVLYANPTARLETIEDAFDIAVKGVLDRVENIRKGMKKAMKAGKKLY